MNLSASLHVAVLGLLLLTPPVAAFADDAAAPAAAASASASEWTPNAWAAEDTLQFRTDCPDEGEYWSWVWVVVLDGDAYVRLGSRAGERVDCSRTKPMTAIRIAGKEFADVEFVPAPEMAERVATAMGEKYWTDLFIRYAPHPYTMRLVPKRAG